MIPFLYTSVITRLSLPGISNMIVHVNKTSTTSQGRGRRGSGGGGMGGEKAGEGGGKRGGGKRGGGKRGGE